MWSLVAAMRARMPTCRSEEELYRLCASVVPRIVDLRVVKDKFTGTPRGARPLSASSSCCCVHACQQCCTPGMPPSLRPSLCLLQHSAPALLCPDRVLFCVGRPGLSAPARTGFAFVELSSIKDAGTLLLACNGAQLPGQSTRLRAAYGRSKEQVIQGATVTAPGALQDSAAPDSELPAVLLWQPKEFKDGGEDGAACNTAGQAGGRRDGDGDHPGAQHTAAQPNAPCSTSSAGDAAAAAAAAGVDAATVTALTDAGYCYQPSSGYWFEPRSGYYYDPATALYYSHVVGQWLRYDAASGTYTPAAAAGHSDADGQKQQQQQQPLPAEEAQQQPVQHGPQQQQQQQQAATSSSDVAASAADKRRRAVIGSAPQYHPEGLLMAAALAAVRVCARCMHACSLSLGAVLCSQGSCMPPPCLLATPLMFVTHHMCCHT